MRGGCPARQPSPKKLSSGRIPTEAFLPPCDPTASFTFPLRLQNTASALSPARIQLHPVCNRGRSLCLQSFQEQASVEHDVARDACSLRILERRTLAVDELLPDWPDAFISVARTS